MEPVRHRYINFQLSTFSRRHNQPASIPLPRRCSKDPGFEVPTHESFHDTVVDVKTCSSNKGCVIEDLELHAFCNGAINLEPVHDP